MSAVPMLEAIARHRSAWRLFQSAPLDEGNPDTLAAADAETDALRVLLATIPANRDDLAALRAHLDWWVTEEAQRRECEPEPFVLHAAITLAMGAAP